MVLLNGQDIITAFDVLFILAIGDPSKRANRPVRYFELLIIILVSEKFTLIYLLTELF